MQLLNTRCASGRAAPCVTPAAAPSAEASAVPSPDLYVVYDPLPPLRLNRRGIPELIAPSWDRPGRGGDPAAVEVRVKYWMLPAALQGYEPVHRISSGGD